MSKWREDLESWLKTIEVSGSVLDVGGAQNPVKGRTKTWDVYEYFILDNDRHKLGDEVFIESIDYEDAVFSQTFKCQNVFLLETLMYTFNPYRALLNVAKCVKPGGNLYISNPLEGYGETKPVGTDMGRMFPYWYAKVLPMFGLTIMNQKIVYPHNPLPFAQARDAEGYKMIRQHSSGILIHAQR